MENQHDINHEAEDQSEIGYFNDDYDITASPPIKKVPALLVTKTQQEKAKSLRKILKQETGLEAKDAPNIVLAMIKFAKYSVDVFSETIGKPIDGKLPLSKNHICFDKGHNMYLVVELDNGRSKYGHHKCSRCGHEEHFQYDYV